MELNDHYGRTAEFSGLTLKHGTGVGAGVIDSNFRGIVTVVLINHSKFSYEVNVGDCIIQMIFEKYEIVKFVELTDSGNLPKTERDSNSSGV